MAVDFLKHYKNIVPDFTCEMLIALFDESDQLVHRHNQVQNFYELNINQTHPEIVSELVQCLLKALREYQWEFPTETKHFQTPLSLEEFRVKRYNGGTGEKFSDHVDVGDLTSCKRYLAFLFYLNDDFEGGNTFFYPGTLITPEKGSVIVFPPTWQYPHAGLPVDSGTKYIMSSYLNYV